MRTPFGRHGGALAKLRPDNLAGQAIARWSSAPASTRPSVDDVILGCANQAGEDNRNVARMAPLLAGFPVEVPGQTVNRLCGSGLQAVNAAAQAIWSGQGDLFVAGGVESMSRAPIVMLKAETAFARGVPEMADSTLGWRFPHPNLVADGHTCSLGETAENVAERAAIAREDQDQFAAAEPAEGGPAPSRTAAWRRRSSPASVPGGRRASRSRSSATSIRAPTRRSRRWRSCGRPSPRTAR